MHPIRHGVGRRPRSSLAGALALTVLLVACGSTAGDKTASTTMVAPTSSTTTTEATTTTATTVVKAPSCDEVTAVIAKVSAGDRAILKKSQMLFFSRLPGTTDGWRILTFPMAGETPGAVYYDWTPSTGLSPPVPISNVDEKTALRHASATVITLRCATPTLEMPLP